MDIKSLARVAKILESPIAIVGAILGGGWALYQFAATRAPEKAQAEIAKLVSENLELQRKLRGDASLSIEVSAAQYCEVGGQPRLIDAKVKITNHGTRSALIDLSNQKLAGLFAVPLDLQANGNVRFTDSFQPRLYTFNPETPGKPASIGIVDIQPSITTTLHYLVPVSEAGLYLVSFSAPMSKSDMDVARERLQREGLSLDSIGARWHGRGYVAVRDQACK